jgi:outer membrane protein OmpA-like peptidoglycan-associated protein
MSLKLSLLAGAAILAVSASAQAAELRGTYVAFEGGATFINSQGFFQDYIYSSSNFTYSEYHGDFDAGWAVFGSVGYAFNNNLRTEIEVGYRRNSFSELEQLFTGSTPNAALSTDGHLSEFSLMANLLYDIHLSRRLTLSLGAGAGGDLARLDVGAIGFKDDDWRFAWQGIAGLNYAIGDRTQLFLNYRYLTVDAPAYVNDSDPAVTHRVIFFNDLEKQTVTVGLRYAFNGEDAPPPPPVQPPAPPPPAPPAAPKQFVVFFGFNKSSLSAEAQQVVNDAAATAKETGAASIVIVGHTDSSGSDGYNEALSKRRATAVKGALVGLGIADDKISTSGKGETELMVQTGDGVKEPQNRRATIDLN